MIEYRFAKPDERAEVIDFINYIFSYSARPHDFKALIPKVYADGRESACPHAVAVENGRVRGAVAQLMFPLRVAGQPLTVGYIGSVSVHPYARGAGSMKALMQMQLTRAEEDFVDIMMLGGNRQRYEYFGFSEVGGVYRYSLGRDTVKHGLKDVCADGISFIDMETAAARDVDAAWNLYERGLISGARPRADFPLICRSFYSKPRLAMENGACVGYLAASADLDELHEIASFREQDLSRMIKAWYTQNGLTRLSVTVPVTARGISRILARYAAGYSLVPNQQVRIVNLKNTLKAYLALANAYAPLKDGVLALAIDDGAPVTARVENGAIDVRDGAEGCVLRLPRLEMQQFLFSANRDMAPLIEDPARWFPLPLSLPVADTF